MKLKQPSANSLVVFDVVCRHLNFTAAAKELKTTRVAVSNQVKQLEAQIGQVLFVRHHRGLRLTPAGTQLFEVVEPSFQAISRALDRLSSASQVHQLSISASHGMSSHWLMPRLHRFRQQHPQVDFRFQITDAYVDLAAEGIDIALRFGTGPWPRVVSKRLVQVQRFAVCSPHYAMTAASLETPQDLSQHTLLHLAGHYGRSTRWSEWLHELGYPDIQMGPGLTFDDHNSLIEAALAGEGIALGGPPQISDYLQRAALIRVLHPHMTVQSFFWSVRPSGRFHKPIVQAFETWLEEEMRASTDVSPPLNS